MILAIMPTFGRRESLIENSVQLFLDQTNKQSKMIVLDDTPFIAPTDRIDTEFDRVLIVQQKRRIVNLPSKYNVAILYAIKHWGDIFDTVAIWDDDDIYLPDHLQQIADTHAGGCDSSATSHVYSTYADDEAIIQEQAAGRFHANYAMQMEWLTEIGGYPNTDRVDFDQTMIRKCVSEGRFEFREKITFVMRWGGSQSHHCSGIANDQDWYKKTPIQRDGRLNGLQPRLDKNTKLILRKAGYGNRRKEGSEITI